MAAVDRTRRGSYEFEDVPSITANNPSQPSSGSVPSRTRVSSTPSPGIPLNGPISAGPYRTSFNVGVPIGSVAHARSASSSSNSSNHTTNPRGGASTSRPYAPAQSPYGAHARLPSLTNSDIAASPFRSSFSDVQTASPGMQTNGTNNAAAAAAAAAAANGRKHARIHSRNLSIFFPRPGTTAVPSIAEDGAQEIEAHFDDGPVASLPTTASSRSSRTPHSAAAVITATPPSRSQLGGSFKFGGRPPPLPVSAAATDSGSEGQDGISSVPMSKANTPITAQSTASSRRGHHHRHSLSHSFFSFMEPGSSPGVGAGNQHRKQPSSITLSVTSPSPTSSTGTNGHNNLTISGNNSGPPSASGWGPISPFPHSATASAFPPAQLLPQKRALPFQSTALPAPSTQRSSGTLASIAALPTEMRRALAFACAEGMLGCALWVLAQHSESLACTGVAYWVAFDAFGVVAGVYGKLIEAGAGQGSLRLPYGAKRTETVALFAQAVYLLFSAVYICKETLEHALLSAGDAGHHHHHSPGQDLSSSGIDYPTTFLWLSFIALSLSSTLHKTNHAILSASGLTLPSVRALYRSISSPSSSISTTLRPSSSLLLSNPYSLFPLACTLLLLLLSTLPLRSESLRSADMLLAGIEALGTGYLAWPAAKALGTVLLQTSPPRANDSSSTHNKGSLTGGVAAAGTMEALLRTMKEIERHPLVMHLPAPHVWQLSPASSHAHAYGHASSYSKREDDSLRPVNGHTRMLSHSPSFARLRGAGGVSGAGVKTGSGKVIVTLELHVSQDLEDVECLELTRWAWARCVNALGQGEEGITVGIVRG